LCYLFRYFPHKKKLLTCSPLFPTFFCYFLLFFAISFQNGPKWPKMAQNHQNGPKWTKSMKITKSAQNGPKCPKIPNDQGVGWPRTGKRFRFEKHLGCSHAFRANIFAVLFGSTFGLHIWHKVRPPNPSRLGVRGVPELEYLNGLYLRFSPYFKVQGCTPLPGNPHPLPRPLPSPP
jgi:hypothetical protein